jgi:signal transduction histidine kinase
MPPRRAVSSTPFHPFRLLILILVSVFTVEACVMALLPLLVPDGHKRIEALVDACLLTLVLAPFLWHLLIAPLRRLAEARAHLLRQIISAQEAERKRIARDLHDEIGQALTTVLVGLRTLEEAPTLALAQDRARELRSVSATALDEVRRLARGLRPSVLDDLGLVAALERFIADYTQAHGIAVHIRPPDLPTGRLPEVVETALYRIVQEALTNTAKHAKAENVWLTVEQRPGAVQVTIKDDGHGFAGDALRQHADNAHLGLSGMRERAALLNGSLSIASKVGGGTTIQVTLPLSPEHHEENARVDRG